MRKTLLMLMFAATVAGSIDAQNNEPKRDVLFTLGENDTVLETKFSFQIKDVRYYSIIKDKTQNLEKLVLNGKVIDTANIFIIENINLFEKTPAYKKYIKEQGYYCVVNGKEYGSYETAYVIANFSKKKYVYSGDYSIAFKQMGQWFVKLPDDRIIGGFTVKEDKVQHPYTVSDEYRVFEVFFDDKSKSNIVSVQCENYDKVSYFNGREFYRRTEYCCNGNIEEMICTNNGDCLIRAFNYKYYINENEGGGIVTEDGIAYLTGEGININGKLHEIDIPEDGSVLSYCFNNKEQYILVYVKNDKMLVNRNGKVIGQYDNPYHYISMFDGGIGFDNNGEYKWLVSRFYEHNQGEIDESLYEKPSMNSKGDYIFAYILNGKCYVNTNGKIEGAYQETWAPQLSDNGTYAYWYKEENGKEYIVINGEKRGPYDLASEPILTKNGLYAYWYQIDGKRYFNINGKIEGFYDKYVSYTYKNETVDPYYNQRKFHIDENGNYLYVCEQNGKTITVINGKKYDNITDLSLTNYSPLEYLCKIGYSRFYADENNKIFDERGHDIGGTEARISIQTVTSADSKHIMTYSSEYPYVIIDNKKYGNGKVLAATYYVELNAFRWSVLEGKELVVYEYKLN
jgi:hypothetical protein